MTEPANRRSLTRFGAVVMSLGMERGYTTQKALAQLVSDEGDKKITQHRLGRWLRGEHEPPWWFCEVLVDALNLTNDEMGRLARANTYGMKTPLDGAA